jgi:hypothetical protein
MPITEPDSPVVCPLLHPATVLNDLAKRVGAYPGDRTVSDALVCCRWLARIADSFPAGGMHVCLL